jgi:predicted dehydrogenase
MTRRDLISSFGAAALTAAPYSRVLGANDRLSIALIGCGARGNLLLPVFQKLNREPLVAVCDVWRTRAEKSQQDAAGARLFGDHRRLLEMLGLDAVIIATPDHWHAPIAIDALNAGKDVYVEKPLTYRMEEGPRIIQAARRLNDRICQVGAHWTDRSKSTLLEFVKSGKGLLVYHHRRSSEWPRLRNR